jgi:hypothetical protein
VNAAREATARHDRFCEWGVMSELGLGRVKTLGLRSAGRAGPKRTLPHAASAAISAFVPTMFMTRVRL